jgi:riboflavin kinase/FMN adenylyltransferase
MQTIRLTSKNLPYWKSRSTPKVMAMGFFDGIHRGHKKVIETAGAIAKSKGLSFAVMSFFPHPKTVLSKGQTQFDYLMPLSKKAEILQSLGVDTFYIATFDKDFLSLLPEQFVARYLMDMNVLHAVAGFDFSYGSKGLGHVDRLKKDSLYQMDVTKVGKVDWKGKKISSTWIRELICKGEMEQVAEILGRDYETGVYWNGACFKRSPYFMLPAPGIYEVGLKIRGRMEETVVFVPANQSGIYLLETPRHHLFLNEKVEIVWFSSRAKGQINQSEKALIYR